MDCDVRRSRVTLGAFIELAELTAKRKEWIRRFGKERGARRCRKTLVGPIRAELGTPLPENVALLIAKDDPRFTAEQMRHDAALLMREHCRACGMCELASK